jgi:glycosyltransferase involved in cell wall biosynthesis
MRIALIAPFGLRVKGTARARALPLGRALVRHGHTVTLFVPPYDSPQDAGQCGVDGGVAVAHVSAPRGRGALAHLGWGWALWRAVRAWQPDAIHAFKPKGPSGLAAAGLWLTRPGLAARLVVDADDWEGPGGWNDDPRTGYSPMQRRFFAWQERFGLSHAHAWTVTTPCLRERALGFGAEAGRVFLLPNGVEPGGRPPAAGRAEDGDAPAALLYTRFAGVRPEAVIALWGRVRAALPSARLIVAGRGLAGEERRLAGRDGIEALGWVEPSALPAVFARCQVAVIPWADTPINQARSSVKARELMAAGLPIVACGVGEMRATVGEGGVVVPPDDWTAFAAAVVTLLTDPGRAWALGQRAAARCATLFDWDQLARVALAAYGRGL